MSAGISTFNKTASEKFQNLTEEDKVQLNATQANETTTLTESQIGKKISDIFGKVRDRTVTKHYTHYRTRLYSKRILLFCQLLIFFENQVQFRSIDYSNRY